MNLVELTCLIDVLENRIIILKYIVVIIINSFSP